MEGLTSQALEAWAKFDVWAGVVERDVALLAHPGFPYDTRPTQGWPLTRLSAALTISAAYIVLLAYGVAVRKPAAKAAKEADVGVLAGIAKEPIKALQIVYNAVQARVEREWGARCHGSARVDGGRTAAAPRVRRQHRCPSARGLPQPLAPRCDRHNDHPTAVGCAVHVDDVGGGDGGRQPGLLARLQQV